MFVYQQVGLIAQIFLTLTICPYCFLLLASSLDGIQCQHKADEYKYLLVGSH